MTRRSALAPIAGALLMAGAIATSARGQTSTNTHALDSLGPAKHAKPNAAAHTPHPHHGKATTGKIGAGKTATGHQAHAAAPATHNRTVPPVMHARPPPPAIIGPPAPHVDLHPSPPPAPVVADPKALGVATPIAGGVRVTFGNGSAALNGATLSALHDQAQLAKATPTDVVTIDAYASGSADDPSSPRRLSLGRALAARAVLINDGVPSTRIYARALGTLTLAGAASDLPQDRLDLTIGPEDAVQPMPVDAGASAGARKERTP